MTPDLKKHAREIIRRLKKAYSDAHCALNHSNAFELLIATILSAAVYGREGEHRYGGPVSQVSRA